MQLVQVSFGEILALFTGIIGSLIASILYDYSIDMKIRNFLKRENDLIELKRRLKKEFRKIPISGKPTRYYEKQANNHNNPFYLFFSDKNRAIQSFKAFMIPPLDNGHTVKSGERLNVKLDEKWNKYLHNLGENIREQSKIGNNELSRRIIFIDQYMLNFFLEMPDRIIKDSGIDKNKLTIGAYDPHKYSQNYAVSVLSKVFQIILLHEVNKKFEKWIKCFYIDKRAVNSNQYYDFGHYMIKGVSVVYMPVYQRNAEKSLQGDRIYLAENRMQKSEIQEFDKDFDALWKNYADTRDNENNDTFINPKTEDNYYDKKFFTTKYFEKDYIVKLKKLISAKLGYEFEKSLSV